MKIFILLISLAAASLMAACAEAPGKPGGAPAAAAGLKFSYPTAQRHAVVLSPQEREFMLNEMHYYLDMIWVTSDALSRDDFDTVAKVARSRIPAMASSPLPSTLEARLPAAYRTYWRATHGLVDDLATVAEKTRNSRETLRQLGVVMQACNECHAIFQFQAR